VPKTTRKTRRRKGDAALEENGSEARIMTADEDVAAESSNSVDRSV